MQIRLEKDIVIPAGTIMGQAPSVTRRYGPFAEALIAFGPNYTGRFTLDCEAILAYEDTFTVLDEEDTDSP